MSGNVRLSDFLASNSDRRLVDGAYMWARANRSDPFALSVALSHIKNGIATAFNKDGTDGFYTAEAVKGDYGQTIYKNMARP